MDSKSILITGANGFIGAWIAKSLCQQGHDVHILHRKSSDLSLLKDLKANYHLGDVTDLDSLNSAMAGRDAVFHLAGLIAYKTSQRPAMEKVNINGTANVIEACKRNNIPELIYMSSVVAIGASFDGTPLNETSEFNVSHLNLGYFETKHEAEKLVLAANQTGLNCVIINPSTVYGPGDARKGSRNTQIKVARGEMPFYTSGGVNIVHVDDLVGAVMSAWNKKCYGERFIVAGENILIKELFQIIAKVAGVKAPGIYLPKPLVHTIGAAGDLLEKVGKKGPLSSETAWTSTLYHWFDSSKAQKQLDLNVRPAEQSIADSVNWMKANGYLD